MDNQALFAVVISIAGGLFAIISSVLNWDYFFENRKAKFVVSLFGRQGSRIFYCVLGLFLFFMAYYIATK